LLWIFSIQPARAGKVSVAASKAILGQWFGRIGKRPLGDGDGRSAE
jgi:hypothetical protein